VNKTVRRPDRETTTFVRGLGRRDNRLIIIRRNHLSLRPLTEEDYLYFSILRHWRLLVFVPEFKSRGTLLGIYLKNP